MIRENTVPDPLALSCEGAVRGRPPKHPEREPSPVSAGILT